MRRVALAVLLALVVAPLVPITTARAQSEGGVTIRLLDVPSERADDPRARVYVVDHLNQGGRIERRVEVSNSTDDTLTIQLYAASARVQDNRFRFGEGRAQNELTRWTRVAPGEVTLAPGERSVVSVTVEVPEDAVDGERYAVIWAELPAGGGTAAVVNRVGIRMYVSVGSGPEPRTDFRIETLTAGRERDGTPVVRTAITNTGGRAIDLSGQLELEKGSVTAGPYNVEVGTTLAPGDRAPAVVHVDEDLAAGPWEATATIRSGELEKVAKATITFPTTAGVDAEPVKARSVDGQRRVLIPIALALLGAVLLALLLWFRRPGVAARMRRVVVGQRREGS